MKISKKDLDKTLKLSGLKPLHEQAGPAMGGPAPSMGGGPDAGPGGPAPGGPEMGGGEMGGEDKPEDPAALVDQAIEILNKLKDALSGGQGSPDAQ